MRTAIAAVLWACSAGFFALALWADRPRRRAQVQPKPEPVTVYRVEGVSIVSDVYLAPLSEAECAEHVRRLQFSQLGPALARACRKPAPTQATA